MESLVPMLPPHLELEAPQVRSGRVLGRTGTARVEGTRRSDRVPEPRRITGRRNAERAPPVRNGRLDRVGPNRVEFGIAVECRDPVVQLRERRSAESAAVDQLEVHVLGQREHGRDARAHAAAQIREVIEAERAGQRDLVGGREAVLGEGGEDVAALVRAEARGDRRGERQARAEVVVRLAIEVEGRLAAQPQARREMVLVLAAIDSAFDAVAPGVQVLVGRDAVGEDRFAAVRRRHLETGGQRLQKLVDLVLCPGGGDAQRAHVLDRSFPAQTALDLAIRTDRSASPAHRSARRSRRHERWRCAAPPPTASSSPGSSSRPSGSPPARAPARATFRRPSPNRWGRCAGRRSCPRTAGSQTS